VSDGRYVDASVGSLAGEAAQQVVTENEERLAEIAAKAYENVPSEQDLRGGATYYDRPVLKHPVWKWYIGAYFVVGGIAGASAVLGAAAQLFGGKSLRPLVRRCRLAATAGTAVGTGLLVVDLGRPERFLNMLRVFRPTSPMSVGSWILAPTAGAAAASVIVPGPLGELAGLTAGALGGPLAGYTAVLSSNTAVPVWQQTRRTLPALFVSSAAGAASSLLSVSGLDDNGARAVAAFGAAAHAAELVAGLAVDKDAKRVERVAEPLEQGVSGSLWRASKVCTCLSLVLTRLGRRRPWARRLAAALGLAGSAGAKFAIFRAGFASARDPRATFDQQRAGYGGSEVSADPARAR
jgi:DMSO reductase anchor subunit